MNIPKKLWQIWIGPKPAPLKWMASWSKNHPDWEYIHFDNWKLLRERKFHNQHLIDAYLDLGFRHFGFAGAADLIRYELLYRYGGFMPGADAVSLNNTDSLWCEDADTCYTVYENERIVPGFVSPIYAANPGNKFLELLINDLHELDPTKLTNTPVFMTTGNEYLKRMIAKHQPKIKIFPSHYFIPAHYTEPNNYYKGSDTVYAEQMWGSTKDTYNSGT